MLNLYMWKIRDPLWSREQVRQAYLLSIQKVNTPITSVWVRIPNFNLSQNLTFSHSLQNSNFRFISSTVVNEAHSNSMITFMVTQLTRTWTWALAGTSRYLWWWNWAYRNWWNWAFLHWRYWTFLLKKKKQMVRVFFVPRNYRVFRYLSPPFHSPTQVAYKQSKYIVAN